MVICFPISTSSFLILLYNKHNINLLHCNTVAVAIVAVVIVPVVIVAVVVIVAAAAIILETPKKVFF